MLEYNPFTGKSRLEAEEAGETVVLNDEKVNTDKLDVIPATEIQSQILSEAKKIILDKKSDLDSQNLASYEKKWKENVNQALDREDPLNKLLNQKVITEKINEEVSLGIDGHDNKGNAELKAVENKIGQKSGILKSAVAAILMALGVGQATEVKAKSFDNNENVISHNINTTKTELRDALHGGERRYFKEEIIINQSAKDMVLNDGRRYRFIYSGSDYKNVIQCIKPNSVSNEDIIKSLTLINTNYKGRISRSNIESIAQRTQRELSTYYALIDTGRGDSPEAQYLKKEISRTLNENPGILLPINI